MKGTFALLICFLAFFDAFGQPNPKADSLYNEANNRVRTTIQLLDSSAISQSIRDYSEAIQIKPNYWQAYKNRSKLYYQTNKKEQAITDLTNAIKYVDKNSCPSLRELRATYYYEMKQYENSIKDWTFVISKYTKTGIYYIQRGKAYFKNGQKDKACADYQRAIILDKNLDEHSTFFLCDK